MCDWLKQKSNTIVFRMMRSLLRTKCTLESETNATCDDDDDDDDYKSCSDDADDDFLSPSDDDDDDDDCR